MTTTHPTRPRAVVPDDERAREVRAVADQLRAHTAPAQVDPREEVLALARTVTRLCTGPSRWVTLMRPLHDLVDDVAWADLALAEGDPVEHEGQRCSAYTTPTGECEHCLAQLVTVRDDALDALVTAVDRVLDRVAVTA